MINYDKFITYLANNDFDYDQLDKYEIIDMIYNFEEEDLCELQSLFIIMDTINDIRNMLDIDVRKLVENNFKNF